jgi:regulator of cell morphogenesis and NO signaling
LRQELPRLDFMTRKVAAVHGNHEPRLHEVRRVFEAFQSEMVSHTKEEDEVIFPAIRKLESGKRMQLDAAFDNLKSEHEKAGEALARFKELTDNYTPPEWACNTFRALYEGLAQLERHTHQHIHQENNVLFPRALALKHP